jgi:hypothetical protein
VNLRRSAMCLCGVLMRVGTDDVGQGRLLVGRRRPKMGVTGVEMPGRRGPMGILRAIESLIGTKSSLFNRLWGRENARCQFGGSHAKLVSARTG